VAENLASGKLETVGTIKDLPPGSDYVVGNFRSATARDLVFFKVGEKKLTVRPVEGDATA